VQHKLEAMSEEDWLRCPCLPVRLEDLVFSQMDVSLTGLAQIVNGEPTGRNHDGLNARGVWRQDRRVHVYDGHHSIAALWLRYHFLVVPVRVCTV
jgi:hypothetical protein